MSDVYEHNKRVLATLVEGDAVEFKRGVYSHWGIYIGNEKVIHVTGIGEGGSSDASNISHIPSVSGKGFNKATVRIDNLFHVASGCKAEKNNSKDIKFPPRPVHEIIETAMAMIGDIDYNLFSQNCEHFVSYCRNNIQVSDQVDTAKQTAGSGGNRRYLVSSSEAQNYVTDVDINASDSTTNVVDVGTVQYSKSRLTDGKTEDCGVFVGDYTKIWSCSRGTDDNPWELSLYQTRQNAVPQIGSKIYDNSDKDKGFLDSIMHTFRAGILDPYVIVSDFQHLHTDDFSVSDYPIRNAARYVDSFCYSPRHNELKEISLKEVEEMVELESQKMLRLCLNSIGFDGVFRLLDPKLTDYEMCAMLSRPCPPLQTYLPMT